MIRFEGAHLTAGNVDLLLDAEFHLRQGDRIGLVGRNGTGKTTLLRAMLGLIPFEAGQVHRRRDLQIGYLPQQAVAGSELSVWEEVRQGAVRLVKLKDAVDHAQGQVERGETGAIDRLATAQTAFQLGGGYAWDERVGTVLHGLGFAKEMWEQPCDNLSGGWQMRTALAKLLLSEPDIAFLDEPTNHLDLHARSWLAEALRVAPWTTVLVSHDRFILDKVVNRVVEVRNKKLYSWTGNFTRFLAARDEAEVAQLAAKEKQDVEIAHLQSFVDRFGAKATKAKQAQSRAKRIDKIERIEVEVRAGLPRMLLPEPPASAQRMLRLQDADIGYPGHEPLIRGLNLEIDREMCVALVGDNGCGKSTILKTLTGQLAPLAGRRLPGDRVRMGIFNQDLAASLDPDATGFEIIGAAAPLLTQTAIRSQLGALGLSGDRAMRPISALSGGEKARVALATLTSRPHNLLLLDEPTNHLDAETVEVLVRALKAWTGALVLISHDRYVVEALATHVLHMTPPYELQEGVQASHFERTGTPSTQADTPEDGSNKKADHAERKKMLRERERAERRLEALPGVLEKAEAEVAKIDEELFAAADDWSRFQALGEARTTKQAAVDALYTEWEELEARIDELNTECG